MGGNTCDNLSIDHMYRIRELPADMLEQHGRRRPKLRMPWMVCAVRMRPEANIMRVDVDQLVFDVVSCWLEVGV